MYEQEKRDPNQDDMVELLEELTLTGSSTPTAPQGGVVDRLSVDLATEVDFADRSRRRGQDSRLDARTVRVGQVDLVIDAAYPMLVGDHYVVAFPADELDLGVPGNRCMVRCTACAEQPDDAERFHIVVTAIERVDFRRALKR